ncbi:sensor histidine kinase [Caminibacter sp.]
MKSSDFKFDIIFAFVIFAFILIVTVTYSAIYIFTDLTTKEFKDKVRIVANNMFYNYKQQENNIKNTAYALANNDIFNVKFNVSTVVVKSVFKSMLFANDSLKEIAYFNKYGKLILRCDRYQNEVICSSSGGMLKLKDFKLNKILIKEIPNKSGIEFIALTPILNSKKGFIEVKAQIKNFLPKDYTFYNIMMIDNKGNIEFSTFDTYNVHNIYDLFNYTLSDKILKTEDGFVSDDIYIKTFSKNIKVIFIQNKSVISKTNKASEKLALIMLLISIIVAIPLGVFFSKPLYRFYEELDKRVKEEIEKRREKEQMLMHQSKLAALGEMLGNIAHQWRHPITRLSLLIQNLEMAYKMGKLDDEKFEKFKENALMQINYMSDTIDDFTNFFKKDTKKVEFCPKEIIENALKLIEGRIRQNRVEVIMDVKNTKPVFGYKTEFSQVILNILNNAIDILKERDIENKKIWIRINGTKIEIEDNAGGVPEDIKDKIFEPYFTTKFQSQGTGIGLYMSRVIITQHFNGTLEVRNSKDGAVFEIKV